MFTKGTRTIDNLFTGAKLTGVGHAVAGLYGGAKITKALTKNSLGMSQQNVQPTPGLTSAPQMSYDGRRNNTMGADGDLALALSKLK
jgi:hypothetical protein